MGVVTIEESEDERSIVSPGLRLRFRWTGDRWTHAIDLGPGPEPDERWPCSIDRASGRWLLLAEAVEWEAPEDDLGAIRGPVFQELHLQEQGDSTYALLVGKAGPHHFSGSFRVSDRIRECHPNISVFLGLEGYLPIVDADIAVRSGTSISCLATTYRIYDPIDSGLVWLQQDESGLCDIPALTWESVSFPGHNHRLSATSPAGLYLSGDRGSWESRLVADLDASNKTHRYTYSWFHRCAMTERFDTLLRARDPEYDAFRRQQATEWERQKVEHRQWLESPELRAWVGMYVVDVDSYLAELKRLSPEL